MSLPTMLLEILQWSILLDYWAIFLYFDLNCNLLEQIHFEWLKAREVFLLQGFPFPCLFPVRLNTCASAPCRNGGSCKEEAGSYRCVCPYRFTGKHCEVGKCHPQVTIKHLVVNQKIKCLAKLCQSFLRWNAWQAIESPGNSSTLNADNMMIIQIEWDTSYTSERRVILLTILF